MDKETAHLYGRLSAYHTLLENLYGNMFLQIGVEKAKEYAEQAKQEFKGGTIVSPPDYDSDAHSIAEIVEAKKHTVQSLINAALSAAHQHQKRES